MWTLNMSRGDQLPWCISYQVWANLIKHLIKYDFMAILSYEGEAITMSCSVNHGERV